MEHNGSKSEECMCRLRNIALHDYQESVTTGQTHGWTDGWTDRQMPDIVMPMCCYASQVTQKRADGDPKGHHHTIP